MQHFGTAPPIGQEIIGVTASISAFPSAPSAQRVNENFPSARLPHTRSDVLLIRVGLVYIRVCMRL